MTNKTKFVYAYLLSFVVFGFSNASISDEINQSEDDISLAYEIISLLEKRHYSKKEYEEIYLKEGENKLLIKLINKRNNLVTREELADKEFDESELRKVDVGITRLRQKIEKIPKKPQFIKTIRSKGYMLVCREI